MPVWRSRAPELEAHAEAIRQWTLAQWQAGSFKRHKFGYGYQTPPTLFQDEMIHRLPALGHLKQAFSERVLAALRQRTNHYVHLPPQAYAFMAWVLVQTNEPWVRNAWHDHAPAVISGCYYLQLPQVEGELEGALAFMRPGAADPFVRQIQVVAPREREFILFPSMLNHRPQPTPSASGLRISINMDAYIHWQHWHEEGQAIDQKDYRRRVLESLDPEAEPPPAVD